SLFVAVFAPALVLLAYAVAGLCGLAAAAVLVPYLVVLKNAYESNKRMDGGVALTDRARRVAELCKTRFDLNMKHLRPEQRVRYHDYTHAIEVAEFTVSMLKQEGKDDLIELAYIAGMLHDSGYWRPYWKLFTAVHEEESKKVLDEKEFSSLFTVEEKAIIKDLIEYTKFFGEENLPDRIDARVSLSEEHRFAGRIIGMADLLTVYGEPSMYAKLKLLRPELELTGTVFKSTGAMYEAACDFACKQVEERLIAFGDAYQRPCLKEYRERFERNKRDLQQLKQAAHFASIAEPGRIALYPGYFQHGSMAMLNTAERAEEIFGNVLVIILGDDGYEKLARWNQVRPANSTAICLSDPALVLEAASICSSKILVRRFRAIVPPEKLAAESATAEKNYREYGLETYFVIPENEYVELDKEILAVYEASFRKMLNRPDFDIKADDTFDIVKAYNVSRKAPHGLRVTGHTVLYAGSFDPVTCGHLEVISRLSRDFKKVYVAIGINPAKTGMFSIEERKKLLRKEIHAAGLRNAEVISYTGLTVDCARQYGAGVLARGARTVKDLKDELPLKFANELLDERILTVLVVPYDYAEVSSSMVKKAFAEGKDISKFVPRHVRDALILKGPGSLAQKLLDIIRCRVSALRARLSSKDGGLAARNAVPVLKDLVRKSLSDKKGKAVIMVIDGDAGTGKTSFIRQIIGLGRVRIIHKDSFYDDSSLDSLIAGKERLMYEIRKAAAGRGVRLVIVEGYMEGYSLEGFAIKVLLTADEETRRKNIASDPGHNGVMANRVSRDPSEYDLVIDNSLPNRLSKWQRFSLPDGGIAGRGSCMFLGEDDLRFCWGLREAVQARAPPAMSLILGLMVSPDKQGIQVYDFDDTSRALIRNAVVICRNDGGAKTYWPFFLVFCLGDFFLGDLILAYTGSIILTGLWELIAMVAAAPIWEEIVFRKWIFKDLLLNKLNLGILASIIVSGIIFSLCHLIMPVMLGVDPSEMPALVPQFLGGVAQAALYVKTGKLRNSIVFHGLYNLSMLLLFLSGVSFPLIALYAALGVLAALFWPNKQQQEAFKQKDGGKLLKGINMSALTRAPPYADGGKKVYWPIFL
ncbi:MAG: pantetheine-phosphate adenylyltransferase, partial [Deltaproteobacteria bacterium]